MSNMRTSHTNKLKEKKKMKPQFEKWHKTQLTNLLNYIQKRFPLWLKYLLDEYNEAVLDEYNRVLTGN